MNSSAALEQASVLTEVDAIYDQSRYLSAMRYGLDRLGSFETWPGARGLCLAGRLAANLGDDSLCTRLHVAAYRQFPRDAVAACSFLRVLAERRGPVTALRHLDRLATSVDLSSDRDSAEWRALRAYLLAGLRDFDAADAEIAHAIDLAPNDPWIRVEWASILLLEDRYAEALESAEKALALRSDYRPAVLAASLHDLLESPERALSILTNADLSTECGSIAYMRARLLYQEGSYDECDSALNRWIELTPLTRRDETHLDEADISLRSMTAYRRGDRSSAIRLCRASGFDWQRKMADKLANAPADARRVELPVPFVRQHHVTCAPATLTAISRFWDKPAEHLAIVERICYDGTPAHSERQWANDSGWTTAEFTLKWDAARALIDRGIPFTLETRATGMGHLQAVIGYDEARSSLLIRDPYYNGVAEAAMPELLHSQRSGGPRGMAMVPADQVYLLADIKLPDSGIYDQRFALQSHLLTHDRRQAAAILRSLQSSAPDLRLTIESELALAAYDGDRTEELRCINLLARRYPEDANLQLRELSLLRELTRYRDRAQRLRELCEPDSVRDGIDAPSRAAHDEPVVSGNQDQRPELQINPAYLIEQAADLEVDARCHTDALRLLRSVLRREPTNTGALSAKAHILWKQRRFDDALTIYRAVYTLSDKQESSAWAFFVACHSVGKAADALSELRRRSERLGSASSGPVTTLAWALEAVGNKAKALSQLDRAIELRQNDGPLLLFAAERNAEAGRIDIADRLLTSARGIATEQALLGAEASIAASCGDTDRALEVWRRIIVADPINIKAQRSYVGLLRRIEGDEAVSLHLETVAGLFPHNFGVRQLWAESLSNIPDMADLQVEVLKGLIEVSPGDGWTRRELAHVLTARRNAAEALAQAEIACAIEPQNPFSLTIKADALVLMGREEEARNLYRDSLQLSVDSVYTLSQWMHLSASDSERRSTLAFVAELLSAHSTSGAGVVAFQKWSARLTHPAETYAVMTQLLQQRPEIWQIWTSSAEAAIDAGHLDEAKRIARDACERFPLLVEAWLVLATVLEMMRDFEGEHRAIQKARDLDPVAASPLYRLSQSYKRNGDADLALSLLADAVVRQPREAQIRWSRARLLADLGRDVEAVQEFKETLRLDPHMASIWNELKSVCKNAGCPSDPEVFARELVERSPKDPYLRYALASALPRDAAHRAECLRLLDHAIVTNPRLFEAYELRAWTYASSGDFSRAISSLRAPNGRVPLALQFIAVEIEAKSAHGVPAAIKRLGQILETETDNYDGWTMMAKLQSEARQKNADGYVHAANRMTELRPQDALAWGYFGQAKLQSGDRGGATASYRQAFDLDPQYEFAALELLALYMESERYADAEHVVAMRQRFTPSAYFLSCGVDIAIKRGDLELALTRLVNLCRISDEPERRLRTIADSLLATAELATSVAKRLAALVVEERNLNPDTGFVFMRTMLHVDPNPAVESWLSFFEKRGAIGAAAHCGYIKHLRATGHAAELQKYLAQNSKYLRQSVDGWQAGADALVIARDFEAVVKWTADWQERVDLTCSAYYGRAMALRNLGRRAESIAVSQAALRRPDPELQRYMHSNWLAVEAALQGAPDAARRYLDHGEDPDRMTPYHKFLRGLAEALLIIAEATPMQRGGAFSAAKARLDVARAAYPGASKVSLLRDLYAECARKIAAEIGGPAAKIWLSRARL